MIGGTPMQKMVRDMQLKVKSEQRKIRESHVRLEVYEEGLRTAELLLEEEEKNNNKKKEKVVLG